MKKYYLGLLLGLLLLTNVSIAQTMFYKDSFYTAPFQRLIGSTLVNLGADTLWDDPTFEVPLGFKFRFFNDSTTSIHCSGDLGLGAMLSLNNTDTNNFKIIFVSFLDLENKNDSLALSPISYLISGVAPNRICKLEWRNAGLLDGLATDSIDIQAWFYEDSDIIEYRYGNVNIQAAPEDIYYITGEAGDYLGIMDSLDISGITPSSKKTYFFQGNPQVPDFDSLTSFTFISAFPGMDTTVSSNTVFRFQPIKPVKVIPAAVYYVDEFNKINLQYNASLNNIIISNASSISMSVQVVNAGGSIVSTIASNTLLSQQINTTNWPNGIYYVQIKTAKGLNKVYTISR